jgi:hypothetical protein
MGMRKHIAGVLACLAFGSALGEVIAPSEDFLKAPDRIEWHAGGLYDGRFEDGTRFQIQLAYPRPASVPKEAMPFTESYWYPKHFTGRMLMLNRADGMGNTLRLVVQPDSRVPAEESFSIALAPDTLSGSGTWTSSTLKKQMAFTLQRAVAYDYVVVQRPAPSRRGTAIRRAASCSRPGSRCWATPTPAHGYARRRASAMATWNASNEGAGALEIESLAVTGCIGLGIQLHDSAWQRRLGDPPVRVDNGRLTAARLDAFVDTGRGLRVQQSRRRSLRS